MNEQPRLFSFLWRLIGWYFFLDLDDARFTWPILPPHETAAGAQTPWFRTEHAWNQYAFVTTDPNKSCYVVMQVDLEGDRCWIRTEPIPPGTRLRFGVGKKPMRVRLVAVSGETCSAGTHWLECRVVRHRHTPDEWTDLNGNPIDRPSYDVHI